MAAGTPLIEDYIPFIKYHGFNTDKNVDIGGTLTVDGAITMSDGTALAVTGAELNRIGDVSTRLITADSATLTVTEATHEGKIVLLARAAGVTVTLPDSTGGGAVYQFLITTTATSNDYIIKVANATDEMRGFIYADASEATAPNTWWAADNDDTITFNRTTTGLAAQGHYVRIIDAISDHWYVQGWIEQNGTEATPFSATVS